MRLLEKEKGIVRDRTTRGTGQNIMEGFYEGFPCLRGDCWRRRGDGEVGGERRGDGEVGGGDCG